MCTGNRDTRVVKVNGMSTAFRGVSLCHSWTYASYWNGGNVDVKTTNRAGGTRGADESAAVRIVSWAPVPFDRRHSTTLASFVRARRRRVRAIVGIAREPLRVASCRRLAVERTNNRIHTSQPIIMTVRETRRRRRSVVWSRARAIAIAVACLLLATTVATVARADGDEEPAEHMIETWDEDGDRKLNAEETSELMEAIVNRLAGKSGSHAGHAHAGHGHGAETLASVSSDELITDFAGSDSKLNEEEFINASALVMRCLSEKDCKFVASHATTPAKKRYTGLKMGLMSAIFAMGLFGGMLPLLVTNHVPALESLTRYLNAFSGGLFLSAGFVHLLPHALESATEAKIGTDDEYPFAMVMCVLGFCLAFGIERVLFHTHSHGPENSVAVQTDAKDDCEKCEEQSLFQQTRSALVFMAGIALHATLAGVSLGAQTKRKSIVNIFVAIASHKSAAAFSVGTQFMRCGVKDLKTMSMFMFLFAMITPVGIIIGYLAENKSSATSAVLEGISAGTFIYVGTIDVVGDEFENTKEECDDDHGHNHKVAAHEHNVHGAPPRPVRLAKFGAYMLGVTFITLVQLGVDHAH